LISLYCAIIPCETNRVADMPKCGVYMEAESFFQERERPTTAARKQDTISVQVNVRSQPAADASADDSDETSSRLPKVRLPVILCCTGVNQCVKLIVACMAAVPVGPSGSRRGARGTDYSYSSR